MSTQLPCTNEDSCAPGAVHTFPDPGEIVELLCDTLRGVGSSETVTVPPGTRAVVTDQIIEEAHQVSVTLMGSMGPSMWVDVDDDIRIVG